MIQQIPSPPSPPFDPNLMFMSDRGPPIVLLIVIAALTAATVILWPIMRALARRMERKSEPDPILRTEIDQLHERLAELELEHGRVAELEERVEFAERLLSRGQDQTSSLPPGQQK